MLEVNYLLAGVVVTEIDAATKWYTKLFGREPTFRPNDYESSMTLGRAGSSRRSPSQTTHPRSSDGPHSSAVRV